MAVLFARWTKPFLVLIASCFLQTAQAQNKVPVEGDCLIRLLGEHINNEKVQEMIEYMGLEPPFHHLRGTDIISPSKGIKISFNKEFILTAITLFNNNYKGNSKTYSKFEGKLPFKLSFTETKTEMIAKLGKPCKTKSSADSTVLSFRSGLLIDAVSTSTGNELYYIRFMLKKKSKTYPTPATLICDSLAKE